MHCYYLRLDAYGEIILGTISILLNGLDYKLVTNIYMHMIQNKVRVLTSGLTILHAFEFLIITPESSVDDGVRKQSLFLNPGGGLTGVLATLITSISGSMPLSPSSKGGLLLQVSSDSM